MPVVKISVMLKPTLLDAQGRVVQNALHQLGYDTIASVRVGKSIEVRFPDDEIDIDSQVKSICDRLLANPVIEDYSYEVLK